MSALTMLLFLVVVSFGALTAKSALNPDATKALTPAAQVLDSSHAVIAKASQVFLTDDGCESEKSNPNDRDRNECATASCDGMLAYVRCCANDGTSCVSDCNSDAVNVTEAVSNCETRGMRLCTDEEIAVCCGTGCGFDSESVWMTGGAGPFTPPSPPPPSFPPLPIDSTGCYGVSLTAALSTQY